jgi:hypothetical protein
MTHNRPDRWPAPARTPRVTRTIHKPPAPMLADDNVAEWKPATQLAQLNPKVNGNDARGISYLTRDDQYLDVPVDMRDNEVPNDKNSTPCFR